MKKKELNKLDIRNESTVILVHGAYHGTWCWKENFVSFFSDKGYNVTCFEASDMNMGNNKIDGYIESLNNILESIQGKRYIICHSLGSSIVERYISKFSPKLSGVIFIAPGPVIKRMRNVFVINLHNILKRASTFYFSDRMDEKLIRKYLSMFQREPKEIELLIVRRNIPPNYVWKYKTLVLGSYNDQCIPLSTIIDAGRFFKAKVIIYEKICHDMMLDPEWRHVAKDIHNFIQMNTK